MAPNARLLDHKTLSSSNRITLVRSGGTCALHLAAVDQGKRVLVLSKALIGKLHDKKFHDEDDIAGSVPDEIPIEVDLGCLGLHKQYDNVRIPHKKPKAGELTQQHSCTQSSIECFARGV